MRRMRRLSVAVVVAVCALAATAPAHADGKQRVVVDRFSDSYELAVPCADFGPYTFDNVVSGIQHVQVTEVLARDGTLLQLVFNIEFSETDTNSETGKTLTLKGAVHEVWDFASNTRTLNGKVFLATDRGLGVVFQDTGRITITLDTREALFLAGPHDVFFAGGVDQVVCAALAAP
jgi:hypothetical protein